MKEFVCYIVADFQKTRRLPIRKAHIFIPTGVAGIFLVYYTYSPWDACSQIAAYFQILGIGYPFLIGLFCALVSEQEREAGLFREILGAPKKVYAFFSKLLFLILLGGFSVLFASLLFGAGYIGFLHQHCVDLTFYMKSALLLLGSSVPLYICHLFLSLRCNKEISVVMGIVESLLSALLLTGMGDSIWLYIPAAWSPRLITRLLAAQSMQKPLEENFYIAVALCFAITAATLISFGIWAHSWEGTENNE